MPDLVPCPRCDSESRFDDSVSYETVIISLRKQVEELRAEIKRLKTPTHYFTDSMEYAEEDLHAVLDEACLDLPLGESMDVELLVSRALPTETYRVTVVKGKFGNNIEYTLLDEENEGCDRHRSPVR